MKSKTSKKKKKTGKKIIVLTMLIVVLVAGCGIYKSKSEDESEDNSQSSIVLTDNQSFVKGQVESITGNEMQMDGETYIIPVGTDVITKLGSATTFSRILSGDKLTCLMENDGEGKEILKVWIEE